MLDDTTTIPLYPDNLVSTTCDARVYVLPEALGNPNCIAASYAINGTHFKEGVTPTQKRLAAGVDGDR
jgi:hypothetical protein